MATIKNYKSTNIDLIIDWCKENNEVEWLKETSAKKTNYTIYPKITVPVLDKDGNQVYNEKGKAKTKRISDKTQTPKIEKRNISFIELKYEFFKKFFPNLLPKAEEKQSMYDRIAAL